MDVIPRILFILTLSAYSECTESNGLAQMISNYARVSTNKGRNETAGIGLQNKTTEPRWKENVHNRSIKSEEKEPDYQDFDDLEEPKRKKNNKPLTTATFLKLFNGIVNILALFYKFDGQPQNMKPSRLHFKNRITPRQNTIANYINDIMAANTIKQDKKDEYTNINGFKVYQPKKQAQDRYTPSTFNSYYYKKQNGGDQGSKPESYPPYSTIKTSYDSDKEMYQFSNQNSDNNDVQSYQPPQPSYGDSQNYGKPDTNYQPWKQEDTSNDLHSYQPSHPVYTSGDSPSPDSSYQPWKHKETDVSYPSWSDHKPEPPVYDEEIDHDVEEEDRDSKRPYSYYFLGRKLWYLPLLFSLYFIVYIGVLILKSVARHKITFPDKLWDLTSHHHEHGKDMDYIADRFQNAVKTVKYKYM